MVDKNGEWELPPEIKTDILSRVLPSPEELEEIRSVSDRLLNDIGKVTEEMGLKEVEPIMAGSVAKGTVSGKPDLDVFVIFPTGTQKNKLEKNGLEIGERVLEDHEKRYTQHPYITGTYSGMKADIVPCLRIKRGGEVQTAVDRTPFHTVYIRSRMDDRSRNDAVLLKSFLKGIGSYGAEDTVNGFSGYLCELLIIYQGSFSAVIRWFASIRSEVEPPRRAEMITTGKFNPGTLGPFTFKTGDLLCEPPLDNEYYLKKFENDTLIIVDPVDPGRNVASPVSDQTLAHTANMSRLLMDKPSGEMFSPYSVRPWKCGNKEKERRVKGTVYSIPLPDENPDMVMTQARSFLTRSVRDLERRGDWSVTGYLIIISPEGEEIDGAYLKARYVHGCGIVSEPVLVFNLISEPEVLPPTYIHWGPPSSAKRARDFRAKWGSRVIEDDSSGRCYVIAERVQRRLVDIFESVRDNIKIGSSFGDDRPTVVENQLIHEVIRGASER